MRPATATGTILACRIQDGERASTFEGCCAPAPAFRREHGSMFIKKGAGACSSSPARLQGRRPRIGGGAGGPTQSAIRAAQSRTTTGSCSDGDDAVVAAWCKWCKTKQWAAGDGPRGLSRAHRRHSRALLPEEDPWKHRRIRTASLHAARCKRGQHDGDGDAAVDGCNVLWHS